MAHSPALRHRHTHGHHHSSVHGFLPLLSVLKKNIVLTVAAVAALLTTFAVPVDRAYLEYFDFKTLTCLFCVLAVVCALKNIRFFYTLAQKIVRCFRTARLSILALVYITFIGSMLIANDMALLTFLPLGFFVLHSTGKERYMAFTFIMQNIAANLGGMLTPFGNPQNLYLYSYFHIPTGEFCRIMLPAFLLAVALLIAACLPLKPIRFSIDETYGEKLNVRKTILYSLLFLASVLIVFRLIPFVVGLAVIPVILFFADRDSLKMVDYGLLGTFFFFFIFAGNLARLEAVNALVSSWLERDTLLVSVLSCQFISNVPSAILLSRFTEDYPALLLGVNIGGTGTLIASLASLITFSEFRLLHPEQTKKYLGIFAAANGAFLLILTVAAKLFWA